LEGSTQIKLRSGATVLHTYLDGINVQSSRVVA
jgi:hypothetical protein